MGDDKLVKNIYRSELEGYRTKDEDGRCLVDKENI